MPPPTAGLEFLAMQDGEIYHARYTDEAKPRLCFRSHSLFTKESYRVITAEMDGTPVKARVAINEPWEEEFRHDWSIWTRGFDFKPTRWMPKP